MIRFAFALFLIPAPLLAAPVCSLPQSLPRPEPDLPSAKEPARSVPIASYTLSVIWGPEACHGAQDRKAGDFTCTTAWNRSHFSLHGLWPDGQVKGQWPQYCRPVDLLSEAQLRKGLCATPSVQLLQHEWAKHGSCIDSGADAFLDDEVKLFAALRFPHMKALSAQRDLTAGQFQSAFAAANSGMTPDMLRLNVNKAGWLEEVWLCLDRDRRRTRCETSQTDGANAAKPIRIAHP